MLKFSFERSIMKPAPIACYLIYLKRTKTKKIYSLGQKCTKKKRFQKVESKTNDSRKNRSRKMNSFFFFSKFVFDRPFQKKKKEKKNSINTTIKTLFFASPTMWIWDENFSTSLTLLLELQHRKANKFFFIDFPETIYMNLYFRLPDPANHTFIKVSK